MRIDAASLSDMICNDYPFTALGWEAAEKHSANANRLHSAYLDDASIAKRAAKREQLRPGWRRSRPPGRPLRRAKGRGRRENPYPRPSCAEARAAAAREEAKRQWEAGRAEREARQRAEREARDKEQAQRNAERAERQAKERIELDRMLAAMRGSSPDVAKFLAEEKRILDSKWSCTVCGGKSYIERKSPGYQLTCLAAGRRLGDRTKPYGRFYRDEISWTQRS